MKTDVKTPVCSHCNGTGSEPDAAAIGKAMKVERVRAKLTAPLIASRMDISHQYLYDLESGKRLFDTELIAKFRKAVLEG